MLGIGAAPVGGFAFMLSVDWNPFQKEATEIDCTNSTSSFCQVRNVLKARGETDAVRRDCIAHGFAADCTSE